ncbi:hypothetical protein Vadar_007471 [Vaccinium darrowii]|uniref:Uncharacterized protein n=1 Tax=Vaccinium darrowii TaxID=229202 RepID=A0ACB7Y5E9_9ERIC|nr:hypothetical protein Vadar_007471 [Vaccinium darrowii]
MAFLGLFLAADPFDRRLIPLTRETKPRDLFDSHIATITFKIDNGKDYVDAPQAEVNGDKWHEIVGSFRLEKPAKVMVYVHAHGLDSVVDMMLAELKISPVDQRATFKELKRKTDEVIDRFVVYVHGSSVITLE